MACSRTSTSSKSYGGNTIPFLQRRQLESSSSKQKIMSRQLLSDRMSSASGYLHSCSLVGHFGCVNAVEFSNKGGELLVSGGDDRRVLIWNLEKQLSSRFAKQPPGPNGCMKGEHNSNIFTVAIDCENRRVFSGGNDDQVIVHDTESLETVDVFTHEDAIYGLSPCPTDQNAFASAGADGRILLWDLRESTRDPFVLANYVHSFHAVVYHPMESRFLASANAKEGVALWDVRKPGTCLLRYSSAYTELNAMSVRFNIYGTKILALRRRLPPAIYNVHCPGPVIEFDHSGYYNSCTMKSCCFAGDRDQYILSGSDDFNLFLWNVPEPCEEEEKNHISEAMLVLSGHRQIVNQVRYNYDKFLIASSGVEKVIKIWSPMKLPGMSGKTDNDRRMFTHQQYFDLMINSNSSLSHDYSHQSTEEDPHMLAFFDSLIQREVERSISSDSDSDDLSPASMFLDFVQSSDDSESTESGRGDAPSVSEDSDSSSSDDQKTYLTLTKGSYDQGVKTKPRSKTTPRVPNFEMRTHLHRPTATSSIPGSSSSKDVRRRESSSEDTSTSQSSGDVFIMKLKSKLFQKITRRRKRRSNKVTEIPGKARFKKSKRQEENDRLTNLRQRTAFYKVLKQRIPQSSDSDSDSNEVVDEVLKTLADSFNQRTDVARQRGAALRIKKLQIANEGQQSYKFEMRETVGQAGTSSVSRLHDSEVRTSNPEQSVNGVNPCRNTNREDNSHTRESSISKVNDTGQRSSCSDDLTPSSSSHVSDQNKDNHFKKMKGSKQKNYRTQRKGSDS